MRKLILALNLLLICAVNFTSAQTDQTNRMTTALSQTANSQEYDANKNHDFDKVQFFLTTSKPDLAKKDFDKIISKNPAKYESDPVAKLYDLYIAVKLSKDPKLGPQNPLSLDDEVKKFNAYYERDKELSAMKALLFSEPLIDIYQRYVQMGRKNYEDTAWLAAANDFENALVFSNLVFKNGLSDLPKDVYDTLSALYSGICYQNGRNYNAASKAYQKVIIDKYNSGFDRKALYSFVLINAADINDKATFDKFYNLEELEFPTENMQSYKYDFLEKNGKLSDYDDFYNSLKGKNSLTENDLLALAEIFSKAKEKEPNISTEQENYFKDKSLQLIKDAYVLNPNNYITCYNLGVFYRNKIEELQGQVSDLRKKIQDINADQITEKDPVKKKKLQDARKTQITPLQKNIADLDSPIIETAKECIKWYENSFRIVNSKGTDLDRKDKSIVKNLCNFLAELYEILRDKYKVSNPTLYDEYDAKSKYYDNLVDTYSK
ncbi:MAG: hypothetical protein ORN85_03965 [Sediminibacterium sp.]|nr:hypothetical protein [Sediminibacterium sp.]